MSAAPDPLAAAETEADRERLWSLLTVMEFSNKAGDVHVMM